MVIVVNAQKFACESCIKGHRSSSCHHTDRPLYEIKKKGRPVSQCEKCRALRKSKKVHSKCTCEGTPSESPPPVAPGAKARRFIPSTPALPNGIKDILTTSRTAPALPADTRQMVHTLLNPCNCKSVWKCKCRSKQPESDDSPAQPPPDNALHTLAEAAASCCSSKASASPRRTGPKRPSSRSSNKEDRKRQKSGENEEPLHPGLELPPIVTGPISMPSFPIMPPLSSIAGLAGTGCTCGFECACPGCVEHRGPEHASSSHGDCAGGNCAHCVDNESGIAFSLPGVSSGYASSLDLFFARAAALPAPPSKQSSKLKPGAWDPTDISARHGLVTIPKLECCGGKCRCPGGQCGCGQVCNGCCDDHLAQRFLEPIAAPVAASPPPVRSCCAGKK